MTASAWLIGSYRDLPVQAFSINGLAAVLSAGSRYLYHDDGTFSLLHRVATAMSGAGVVGASAVLLRNRHVRLSGTADFTVNWPADNLLRDLLGFTGDLAGDDSYDAPLISRLLWSPGRPESPTLAPLGVVGHWTPATYHAMSPYDGNLSSVTHGPGRYTNSFWFKNIAAARYQTASNLGGEWSAFFAQVCVPAASFYLWRNIDESDASATPVTWTTRLGPYVMTPQRRGIDWSFTRSAGGVFQSTDRRYDHTVGVHVVPEYTS